MDKQIYLQKLGLSKNQARIMAHLENTGDSTALEISGATKVPYTKIYSVLDSLRYMGFVVADLERPMTFKAVPIKEIAQALVKRQEENLTKLKEVAKNIEG